MNVTVNKYTVLCLVLFALILRVWGIGAPASYTADEINNIPEAKIYALTGHQVTSGWYHPPFRQLLYYSSLRILGDNPYGWRAVNVACGTLSVLLLILISRQIFSDDRIAILAGLFLAIEPLQVFYSRTAFGEIPAMFFFLACVYAVVRYLKGSDHALLLAGISFGLALAIKWYFVIPGMILLCVIIIEKHRQHALRMTTLTYFAAACCLLPVAVYALTYYPWFGRGYDLAEFLDWQLVSYREQQAVTIDVFPPSVIITMSPSFVWWFVKPIVFGSRAETGNYLLFMSDFPVWLMTLPAVSYLVYHGCRLRNGLLLLVPGLFLALYLQQFLVHRPIYFYSSIQLQPYFHMAVAFFIVMLMAGLNRSDRLFALLTTVLVAWGLYLYPLAIGVGVNEDLYAPLLALGSIVVR